MGRAYAGIGSRRTPPAALELARSAARALAAAGWTLRSGNAAGADRAFAAGAGAAAEIYLPWPGFGPPAHPGARVTGAPSAQAAVLSCRHHRGWAHLSAAGQALHARNAHQVLGAGLEDPAGMVICWTPDGSLDGASRASGGTGQALRIAAAAGIPVLNLAVAGHAQAVAESAAAGGPWPPGLGQASLGI